VREVIGVGHETTAFASSRRLRERAVRSRTRRGTRRGAGAWPRHGQGRAARRFRRAAAWRRREPGPGTRWGSSTAGRPGPIASPGN